MRTVKNVSDTNPTTTYHVTPEGLKVSGGSLSFDAKFDGKDYPVHGDSGSTVALKLIGDDTIEETAKQDGKVMRVTITAVAKDGRSMRVESTDKQRGGTMTYTARKRP